MTLADRILSNNAGASAPGRAMLGASKVRPRDTLADVSRELKFNVQKRLLETRT
ncbi:MAG: hypothetical protein ACLQU2_09220 [Candidatus Binataceae bacterium]